MHDNLNKLEEFIGAKFSDWTPESIEKLLSSEEFLALLTPELILYIVEDAKLENESLKTMITPLYYSALSVKAQEPIDDLMERLVGEDISQEDFNAELVKNFDSTDLFVRLYSYWLALTTDTGFTLKDREDDVRDTLETVIEILNGLNEYSAYQLIVEMFDVITPVVEIYAELNDLDLLAENTTIEVLAQKLDDIAQTLAEELDIDLEDGEWEE